MYGQIGLLLLLCVVFTQAAGAGQTRLTRQSLPMHHTLYEQMQGEFEAAYGVAEYYKLKGGTSEVSPELILVQASASLELEYLAHGRELINDLDEGSLLPENQSRLHLYLARDAYRRRDWPLLNTHLAALDSFKLENRHYYFLLAESARQDQHFDEAEAALTRLDAGDVYQFYVRFNLASSLVGSDQARAVNHLESLIDLPARDLEQLLLTERSRVALADLYLTDTEDKDFVAENQNRTRGVLSKVSASYQYGPMALARLAQIDMQAERFQNAAAIWHYLLQNYPWHRAATAAPSGLGYALLQSTGEEAAYGSYLTALEKIETQRKNLSDFSATLQDSLQDPGWMPNDGESEGSLLIWLAEGLGHDDWTTWLADESVRASARRWQSLDAAFKDLAKRREDLAILLNVDAEQQRRVLAARKSIQEDNLQQTSRGFMAAIEQDIGDLNKSYFEITDDLSQFATDAEAALLREIEALSTISPAAKRSRVARLKGLVSYQIYEAIPVRKQQQQEVLNARLADVRTLEQRITRINATAERLPLPDSVSSRITLLAAQTETLSDRTELALGLSRNTLMASMVDFIDRDQALLAAQANGLQYDIARLLDQQFLAEAAP